MGYCPGFMRRASLTLRLGSCLASLGKAQMANVLKKKKVSFSISWSLSLETPVLHYFLASSPFRNVPSYRRKRNISLASSQLQLLCFRLMTHNIFNSLCSGEHKVYLWCCLKFYFKRLFFLKITFLILNFPTE